MAPLASSAHFSLAFQGFYLALIVLGTVTLAGNTFYPSFLRLQIWIISKLVPKHSSVHHSLLFLLQHPRRCFILLFPSINTWALTAIQTSINLSLWIFWVLLQLDYPSITKIPPGNRTISGLFQAPGVRTSGLYVVSMTDIAPALLTLYTGAMYISGLPVIVSIRSSNVYEEKSLGIEKADLVDDENEPEITYIGASSIPMVRQGVLTNIFSPTYKSRSHQTPGGSVYASSSSAS